MITKFMYNSNINPDYAFTQFSEAGIYNGQVYAGCKYGNVSKALNTAELIKKDGTQLSTDNEFASGTNFSSTSGNLPSHPIYYMSDVVETVSKEHPMWAMIQKRAMKGKFFVFNQRTARGSASFKYEDPALDPTEDTLTKQTFEVKSCYAIRRISKFNVKVHEGYRDIVSDNIMSATEALLDLIEQTIFTGDASSNPYEFSGFDNIITTNTENQSGAELTISKVRELIRWSRQGAKTSIVGTGKPSIIVTNYVDYDKLKELLQPHQRFNNTTTLAFGINTYSIDGIPVISDPFANITAGSRRLYVLDMRHWYMEVLQDLTYEELPQDSDSMKFHIKAYLGLNCEAEMFNSMAYGIGA